ncbi:ABC transporter permease [Jiangella rhizosphaerae]|nr:ABC transporter permease [Jiangella rhizosphaerae]
MSVLFRLARQAVKGRVPALAGVVLVLAVGGGAGIAALVAAWRTDHAYADYLRDAEVAEVVVNPSLRTDRARAIVEATPGVLEIHSDVLLFATMDDGAPRPVTNVDAGLELHLKVSPDGRYVEQDRPVVHEGRMIAGGNELFLSVDAARDFGVEVGDEVPLSFWDARDTEATGHASPDVLVEPAGRETAEVVGIGVFADGVLADELYPRRTALVSQDLAAPYLCPAATLPDEPTPVDELVVRLYPPGCSVTYEYFSLRVAGGDAAVGQVLTSIAARFEEESARLPEEMVAEDVRYYMVPKVTADEEERIDRSLDPSVTALRLFGVAATGASLVLAVLAVVRIARPVRPLARVWWQVGAPQWQRAAAIAVPLAGSVAAGMAGAVLLGWLASGIGPVASARAVDPSPALVLPGPVVLPVAGVSVAVLLAGVAVAAFSAAKVTEQVDARPARLATAAARSGNVPFTLGVRAALRGGAAVVVLGAMVTAVLTVLGSVVFSTNLARVIETPARYGWSYDAAAITGGGYGDAAIDAIAASLDRPEVDGWGVAALGSANLDGEAVPFVAHRAGFAGLPLPVVEGDPPVGDGQLAVGALTARRLRLEVGDTVTVSTSYGSHTGTISGLVVLPPIGPILTDRAGLGTGLVLPAPFLERALESAADRGEVDATTLADQLGSFIAIDLAAGVDPDEFLAAVDDDLTSWDALGYRPFVYTDPVRPPQIADVAAMRSAPVLLAVVIAAASAVGLGVVVRAAARGRRRELAVLRVLGATGRQVRATLRWQALTIVGVGLAFGLPLGVALGRATWAAFADGLGIAPGFTLSATWTALIAAAAVVVGIAAASLPARASTRLAPAAVLRAE